MSDRKDRETPRSEEPGAAAKPAGPDPAETPESLDQAEREEFARIEAELAKANDQHLRARAELANYQKRVERDRLLASQGAKRDFIRALLPALDALNLAIKHAGPEAGALIEGVKAARDAFEKALASQGAERIASTGTWNPDLHQPQAAVEHADLPEGTIIEEIRPGYKVGGLVARHGEVVVSKRPAEKAQTAPPEPPAEDKKD
jgi:molecular chaperone GrpE